MDRNTVMLIVIAVIAVVAIGLLLMAGKKRRGVQRHAEAEEIREHLRREDLELRQRESITAETEARARAAQAEADAKTAEAERLQSAAEGHRAQVSDSREELEKRRAHADSIDPHTPERQEDRQRQDAGWDGRT